MTFLNGRAEPGSTPVRNREPFPLTDIQHAQVIGRHRGIELGGAAGHVYLEIEGPTLDVARLAAALRQVVARHDMLRAVTTPDGAQRVLDEVPAYSIEVVDLRDRSADDRRTALEAIRSALSDEVRPTDRWPLFDVRASLPAPDRTRLHLSFDLLFVDLRGLFAVLAEWRRAYDEPDLVPEPVGTSFRDYVLRQAELADGEQGRRAREYWTSRLAELPLGPDLPLATSPELLGRPVFRRLETRLTGDRWTRLREAADRHDVPVDTVLLAAYCEVVRKWSRRSDFTVARTVLDPLPLHPRIGEVVGDFLSLGLPTSRAGDGETFAGRVRALADLLRADAEHAAFSGIRVLRELTRARGDGRAVGMPVVFTSTLGADPGGAALELFGEVVHFASQTPQVWLENQVRERADGLVVGWNAVEGLFPAGVLEDMFDAYAGLLDRLGAEESTWQDTGGLVPLPVHQRIERDRANDTAADLPAVLLHDLVGDAARRRPDAVAIIADGAEVTFGRLVEDAHRLAHRLRERGHGVPNTLVAVSMRPGAALFSALLGVLHAGAAYVSIDPELPEQRRHRLLARCAAKAVITDAATRDALAWPDDVEVITPEDEATRACPTDRPAGAQRPDDLAYVIFTSGSTGEPKGVMISHRSAGNTVQDVNRRFEVGPSDRVLALAPTGFDLSVYDVFGVLGAGGAVVVPEAGRGGDVAHWTELVDRHGVTLWNSVPAPMRLWVDSLAERPGAAGASVRLALLSGDWIPVTLPGRLAERLPGLAVISLGGATEGSIWSIHHPIGEVSPDWASIPYGKPLANQTMHVLDERLEPCPVWSTGEIHIGGVGVAAGYWADPERTAERFFTHPVTGERLYRTGDLGRYLPGGDIEILGRTDFQVKINGYRVELGEIEAALGKQPGVAHALVAAPVHPRSGQRQLAAYVVADGTADPALLRKALAEVLPGYMVPTHYLAVDSFPMTPNGKIDHGALPTPWHEGAEADQRAEPRDDVEQRLLRIWCDQLGHEDFGVEDGFFDVGGDSLHAVGIIGKLRAEFAIDSAGEQKVVEGLFTNSSIAEFGDLIRSLAGVRA
ncbi:amino acid adenylation domain-containing protein [Actinosynnema sp. NPDC023587]|uniref:non-ribosomal peptide synthetase n=1 Tax=Actinosynnema sp. NPDC023587 TaxID=3154695 RepID=UPI0033F541CF